MTKVSTLDEYMEVQDVAPKYEYFMLQLQPQGHTRIWGAFQTFARFMWDERGRWAFPKETVLFMGTVGGPIRCRAGLAPRRLASYANQHGRDGFVHLNSLVKKTGRRPDTADVQQHYPDVDEAVQKFLFWHKLGKKAL